LEERKVFHADNYGSFSIYGGERNERSKTVGATALGVNKDWSEKGGGKGIESTSTPSVVDSDFSAVIAPMHGALQS